MHALYTFHILFIGRNKNLQTESNEPFSLSRKGNIMQSGLKNSHPSQLVNDLKHMQCVLSTGVALIMTGGREEEDYNYSNS